MSPGAGILSPVRPRFARLQDRAVSANFCQACGRVEIAGCFQRDELLGWPVMGDAGKTLKLGAVLLYALSIAGAVVGFLVIQSWGLGLSAPAPPEGALNESAQTAALHAHAGDLLHVLLALVAVVALARILGTVFRLFHQPPVIGEIIAGIMLGPSLLGRVAPAMYGHLFPSTVASPLSII